MTRRRPAAGWVMLPMLALLAGCVSTAPAATAPAATETTATAHTILTWCGLTLTHITPEWWWGLTERKP